MVEDKINIAKILFMFHKEETVWDETMERMWDNLQLERNMSDPYSVSRKEYIRMAEGVINIINKKLYNTYYENVLYD